MTMEEAGRPEEGASPPEPPRPGPVELRVELDRRVNWAMQQNDVPLVKAVRVENLGAEPIPDLELHIRAEPDFASEWCRPLGRLAPGASCQLEDVDLVLSPTYLSEVVERVAGLLRFELRQGDALLAERTEAVELLARDEWSGLGSLPEILAAFVCPNHPAVEAILGEAARVLGRWTGDPSLSGYQTQERERVAVQAAAIYEALREQDVTYTNPPASFEDQGQKVRLPDRIMETRLATCLDLTLLAAACLEQAGLHPLLLLVPGHAFAGVWLLEECFPEPATDDGLRVRKRVELDEVLLFDPTALTARPARGFKSAVAEGRRHLDRPEDLLVAVDVLRARKGRIRPIPERVRAAEEPEEAAVIVDAPPDEAPDFTALAPAGGAAPAPARTPASRLDAWRRKLLDLTLRNRLLNFRETRRSVPLLCPDLAALEDALAEGAAFRIQPRPEDLAEGDPRDAELHRRRTGEDPLEDLLKSELAARRLRSDLLQEELDRRLLETYRHARTQLEEGGASALYLALGFLSWYESAASTKARRAPILLIPLELTRRTVRSGFELRLADEEPRVNVTLLEMLRQDHGLEISGLDPLPEDEAGIDVPGILRTFRQAVRDVDRWEVQETAAIGFFSFAKFLMWRDLALRADSLLESPIVEHLVLRPDRAFQAEASFPIPGELDRTRSATETCCPLPVDSSQLAAVFAAADGRSFVLEGPPGTGKSQTITNLIAHCLAQGRTVLFVSEKMAALEVVHSRLERIGLSRFCLELHSNKARKRSVIEQLGAALEATGEASQEEWEQAARRLEGLRGELNAYVEALHGPRSTGESAFLGTARLIGLREVAPVRLDLADSEELDADRLARLRDLVGRLATAEAGAGGLADHPFAAFRRAEWGPAWQREVEAAVERLEAAIDGLQPTAAQVAPVLGFFEGGWSRADLECLHQLAAALLEAPAPRAELLTRPDWDEVDAALGDWIERGRRRDGLRADLHPRYRPAVTGLDLDALDRELRSAEGAWWPIAWWRRRSVRRALRELSVDGRAPSLDSLARDLERAIALRGEERALAAADELARALLGRSWADGEADWDEVDRLREWARTLRSIARRAAGMDLARGERLRETWARLVTEGRELLRPDGEVWRGLVGLLDAAEEQEAANAALAELAELDLELAWGEESAADHLERAARMARRIPEQAAPQRQWCAWRRVRGKAAAAGLGPLIVGLERGELAGRDLAAAFERSFYQWWTDRVVESEPRLRDFSSAEHGWRIQQFRGADEAHARLTRALVVSRLAARVPRATSTRLPTSELGILRRELAKQRRHMAVRKLFRKVPNLLPRLKPCLMMSPMSVAQYLDPDFPPFDLVVFDEASQIPPWDAIGAIARGSQAVVVGDPKQLPPTSFFQRADAEEEEDEDPELGVVDDLESILDDCLASGLRSLPLSWHYRSRHESLITFSNRHYYDGRLLTFPSPLREGMGVAWRHVPEGVYDKGRTRTNRREAEEVVAEIRRRLEDPARSSDSIGVVTFNLPQQTLIENLLEELRREDPQIDRHFGEEVPEAVFVKNLENVQGDERDLILFSVGYGPDAAGRVSMNFGPMNRDGGERRLNVAITRARREVLVFSTLRAEQIDLARTRARGVRDLKSFLEYAERGPPAIAGSISAGPEAELDAPFESDVRDALVARGWEAHLRVGCSGYRVDVGVVDPEAPERYLLGVECDGANYRRAETARDRDKLREEVLRSLGWSLHRIWSSDWWTDRERELERLDAALERARAGEEPPPPEEPEQAPALPSEEAPEAPAPPPIPDEADRGTFAAAPAPTAPRRTRRGAPPGPGPRPYEPTPVAKLLGSQEELHETSANRAIRRVIEKVVSREGPISLQLAARRVAAHWGFERITSRTRQRIRELISEKSVRVVDSGGVPFLWPIDLFPSELLHHRVPGEQPASQRAAKDLPLEEICNAARHLLASHVSAPVEDLARELARTFGYQRMGSAIRDRMLAGIDLLVAEGGAARGGDDSVVLEQ